MKLHLLVNTHGKVCLVHDEPFEHVPLWVKYMKIQNKVEILFDNGSSLVINTPVPVSLNSYLVKANKVNVIRTEGNIPVEGFETFLLNDEFN